MARDLSKATVSGVTQAVFFFGVRENPFNCPATHGVGILLHRGMSDIFDPIAVIHPYVLGNAFLVVLALGTEQTLFTGNTVVVPAFIFPIPLPVGGDVMKDSVFRTKDTVIVFVVYVIIPREIPMFRLRSLVK